MAHISSLTCGMIFCLHLLVLYLPPLWESHLDHFGDKSVVIGVILVNKDSGGHSDWPWKTYREEQS